MKSTNYLMIIMILVMMITSCNEDSNETLNNGFLNVSLVAGAAQFNSVNLDIKTVKVKNSDGTVVSLNTHSAVYNLLSLNNDELQVATGQLDSKQIVEVILVLGLNNTVVKNDVSYPLILPESGEMVLHAPIHKTVLPGSSNFILLNFDLMHSITSQTAGHYLFQPVFRAIDDSLTGTITGRIVPAGLHGTVRAVTTDHITFSSISPTGQFRIRGLMPGNYSVSVIPEDTFLSKTINNIKVDAGSSVDLGLIRIEEHCDFCKIKERL